MDGAVRHFQGELEALHNRLLEMGGLAEERVRVAVDGLVRRDHEVIDAAIRGDEPLNRLHIEIDDRAFRLLALFQPMATDLRSIVAALKINTDLERVGDLAVNIAEAAKRYVTHPPVKRLIDIPRMADLAQSMLRDALDAKRARPFGREADELIADGGEKVGSEVRAGQEVDHYRAWKQVLGESPWSLTSTFGSLRYEVTSRVSLNAGYDNRRSVRLYRDAITPETAFDDTFRQGVWGGLALRFPRARIAFDARSSGGGVAGRTVAYTLSAALSRVAGLGMGLRSRTTRYDGPRESGWLQAVDLDFAPLPSVLLTVNGGLRLASDPLADPTDRTITWIGTDLDLNLGRRWYLNASVSHESGTLERNDQVYGGLSYRF